MLEIMSFYYSVMKNGKNKGSINTKKQKIKYIVRNLLLYKHSNLLGRFLLNHKFLKMEVYRYPSLCSKIHRPYLTNDLEVKEKVESIITSYTILDKLFEKKDLGSLYRVGKIELCKFKGKNESEFSIEFRLYPSYEKEGEFTLVCCNCEGKALTKLTFGILKDKIIIGGLQGLEKGEDRELIKEATKNMYGIFPKRLVLEILYQLFPEYKKIGVSKDKHIYFSPKYRKRKEGKIHADYDEFWESVDGIKKDGVWLLPEKLVRKNIEDIPAKKRSMYNNRFNLLDDIFNKISFN